MDNAKDNAQYIVININEYLNNQFDEVIGEVALKEILSDFSCPKNSDVEYFLKNNAIDFAKQHLAVSYLVFSSFSRELLGYFAITIKPLVIKGENINSNSLRRKIEKVSRYDENSQTYTTAAYLIAQIGKNFNNDCNKKMTGNDLIALAWDTIKEIQQLIGSTIVFLEAEDNDKLLKFYGENGFKKFDTRVTKLKNTKEHELIQLLRILK